MEFNFKKAVLAGIAGTIAMTIAATFVAPMMGLPKMDVPGMLASVMGGVLPLGWAAHFMIGMILAVGYAALKNRIPGPEIAKGMIYGLAPWLMAQVVVMPMMGMGFFSGAFAPAFGSLIGHLIYGGVIAAVYSKISLCQTCHA